MRKQPDRQRAIDLYRRHAANFDRTERATRRMRRHAVFLLSLSSGDTVLDVGCGTGLSLPMLRDAVGSEGEVIGAELSPDMAAKARERIQRHGWENVSILEAPAEETQTTTPVDAVLFFLTHDVMRSPAALERTFSCLRDGGRVVAFGAKLPPLWAFPLIPIVWLGGRRYVTTYEGVREPWSHLPRWIPGLRVRSTLAGCAYFAWGMKETSNDP